MNLSFSYNQEIDKAYVITIDGNEKSEHLSNRCLDSCSKVGQNAERYSAFNGTGEEITSPYNYSWLKWIKQTDQYLSLSEVACALSHISLWVKCIEQDHPLIVLEHDAIMTKALTSHPVYNSIIYLGSIEQQKHGWSVGPTPPHATVGPNYHFMCRAHAYSIDPAVAKNMVAHVIKYGIHESLDIMLRADIFPICQVGLFAYDDPDGTTITGRKKTPYDAER